MQNSIDAINIIVEDCQNLLEDRAYAKIVETMLVPIFNLLIQPRPV